MKTKLIATIILSSLAGFALAEDKQFTVTKTKVTDGKAENTTTKKNLPDAEFRIKSIGDNSALPDLVIPTYSTGMRRRVADARISKERFEVVVQTDELSLDYYDYRLEAGKWILKSQNPVCSLSGSLALALAQVDILEGGVVEIKYHEESSVTRKSNWNDELINKDHKPNEKLNSERYTLKEAGFELAGVPSKLRPKSTVTPKIEEQNKAQHPTDGTLVPEKPKE